MKTTTEEYPPAVVTVKPGTDPDAPSAADRLRERVRAALTEYLDRCKDLRWTPSYARRKRGPEQLTALHVIACGAVLFPCRFRPQ